MKKRFNRKDRFGGERDFRKGNRDSGQPVLHRATCNNCGIECEVPFKPTGSKPVYCSNCFDRDQNEGPRRSDRGRGGRKFSVRDHRERDFSDRSDRRSKKFVIICDECGDECEVPFRPKTGKPVYCDPCFEKNNPSMEKGVEELKEEIALINNKLDMILEMLKPAPARKKVSKKEKTEAEDPAPKQDNETPVKKKAAAKETTAAGKTAAAKTPKPKKSPVKKTAAKKTAKKT